MAGHLTSERERTHHADILFDLTPDDDKRLTESDLLDLINYGQVQKPIKVPGVNGKIYEMDIALLWDEDLIDILKRTTSYATDPLLRERIMRRLKLHKAIQRIDTHNYSDANDAEAKRELWSILSHMSEAHIEYLNTRYIQIKLERDLNMMDAVKALSESFDNIESKDKKPAPIQNNANQHLAEFQQVATKTDTIATAITDVVEQDQGVPKTSKSETVKSPKQNAN